MSYRKYIEFSCDECGDTFHGRSVEEVKDEAKRFGWITRKGKDICEKCKIKAKPHDHD